MKVVAFGGSISSTSINKELAKFALSYFATDTVELLDLNEFNIPTFSVDLEKEGFPEGVKKFVSYMEQSDVIICSSSEHNRDLTAAFKSVLDWSSRFELKFLDNKPLLLLSTSPGGYGAKNALHKAKEILPIFGAIIPETFSLPKFYDNFEVGVGITNKELKKELEEVITRFKATL